MISGSRAAARACRRNAGSRRARYWRMSAAHAAEGLSDSWRRSEDRAERRSQSIGLRFMGLSPPRQGIESRQDPVAIVLGQAQGQPEVDGRGEEFGIGLELSEKRFHQL